MAKVLQVAHLDWTLYNFRLPLARALHERGYEVVFVCPYGEYTLQLQEAGFRWRRWSLVRRSLNPVREIWAIVHLCWIYYQEKPTIVYHFTIKPNLYGSLAAILVRKVAVNPKVINTFEGLGYLFSDHPQAQRLRTIILPLMRWTLRTCRGWSLLLNRQDLKTLLQFGLITPSCVSVINGVGVDVSRFHHKGVSMHSISPIVLMASRLLWDKGVKEFVEAARILHERGVQAQFWLAGAPDEGNPMCVPESVLWQWHHNGLIRWLGHCDDMPDLLRQVDIAVLPSYHEGVSRFLLEAAATGLPLIATDIEGCRMVVRDGINGFLVPVRDPHALAEAIERLVCDAELRQRMGKASREIAVQEFDERKILAEWLELYERVLSSRY